MRKMLLIAALGLSFTTACYTTRVQVSDTQGRLETHRRLNHTFFWGIVSLGSVDAARICEGGEIKEVKSQLAGLAMLGNWLTAGIWTPMTVRVTCVYPDKADLWMEAAEPSTAELAE